MEAWYSTALDIEEVPTGAADSDVHLFVADVVKSFDTVDREILDRVLSSLGRPAWFRNAYFEYHAHVRLRFKLASGLWEPWTRDGVRAARFTTGYVRLVGQEPAPSKCVLSSTSRAVRKDIKGLGVVPGGGSMVCQI